MARWTSNPGCPVAGLLRLEQRHARTGFRAVRRRILRGEPGAGRQLVERYSRTVYTIALKLAGPGQEREELAQQVYAAVLERLSRDEFRLVREFRGDARFETYLFGAVRNEMAELRRRASKERNRDVTWVEESMEEHEAGRTPFAESIDLDPDRVADLVRGLLEELDPRERTLLHLRFREGCSYRRLAELFHWKDTNAAAYEVKRTLRKLDLLGSCRTKLRWDEPERRTILRCLGRWLEAEEGGVS